MRLLRNVAAFWLFSHQDLTKVNKSSRGGQESTFNVFNFCLTSNKLMDFHQQCYDGESIFTVPPRRRGGTRENRCFLCELSKRRSLWMNEAWIGVTPPLLKINNHLAGSACFLQKTATLTPFHSLRKRHGWNSKWRNLRQSLRDFVYTM